jgi:hypothetical protein
VRDTTERSPLEDQDPTLAVWTYFLIVVLVPVPLLCPGCSPVLPHEHIPIHQLPPVLLLHVPILGDLRFELLQGESGCPGIEKVDVQALKIHPGSQCAGTQAPIKPLGPACGVVPPSNSRHQRLSLSPFQTAAHQNRKAAMLESVHFDP